MRYKLMALAVFAVLIFLSPNSLRAAEIPLGTSGGIYTVPVQVNRSVTAQFLVDPGAGVVVIPVSMLRNLIANGTIAESDVLGFGTAELADSSMYLTARVRLRELRIGNTVVQDVTAAVSPGLTQPLLGQSFLQRFATVTFDNRRHVLILSEDMPVAAQQPPAAAWVAPYPAYPSPAPLSGGSYAPPAYNYPSHGR
jgi:clan AA aspartic protease (TIGR02281 family)